jgi:DNA-binding transcriptional MerR regulator
MSTPPERPYLSIGEVLELLKTEYPDLSISRIRALEASGLLELERTPSGYRKFYDADVEYLRTVLAGRPDSQLRESRAAARRRQDELGRDNAVPDNMHTGDNDSDVDELSGELPGEPERRHPASFASLRRQRTAAEQRSGRSDSRSDNSIGTVGVGAEPLQSSQPLDGSNTSGVPGVTVDSTASSPVLSLVPSASSSADPASADPASDGPASDGPSETSAPLGSRNPLVGGATGVSMSLDELVSATGVSMETVRELEGLGLLKGQGVFSAVYYDEDALLTCKLVAAFQQHGVEPRHLRMYKLAADREASFFEQVVTPQLRRRNPDARDRAIETLGELVRLGEQLRVVALRQVLRAAIER